MAYNCCMEILQTMYNELVAFFSIGQVITMFKTGDYAVLNTLDGVLGVISPLIPLLLVIELIRALLFKKFKRSHYRIQFFIYVFNNVVGRFISIGVVGFIVGVLQPYALFNSSFTWYWLIYGYIVWELAHFVYHFLGHKVRLFWCLHSTHHAPEAMNLSVTYAHFFLEGPYADLIRTSICILLGVNPPLLFFIMFIDGFWGAFIHAGENLIKDGRLGFLQKLVLTPSHHRVHHARNPLYMDTNFCNLLNIWDKVFKTFQPEHHAIPPEYGITRTMNAQNFWDVYFGEFAALAKDMYKAPGITNKLLYLVMPPGWSHTGNHKTASVVRAEYLQQQPLQ